jgi:hypothetical protein
LPAQVRDLYDHIWLSLSLRIITVLITWFNSSSCLICSRSFSGRKYRRDLHKDFNRFLQAQALWDEGMAEAACQFLVDNP